MTTEVPAPAAGSDGGASSAGVISTRAEARYSGDRSQVKARLIASAVSRVAMNTRRRRALLRAVADEGQPGCVQPAVAVVHTRAKRGVIAPDARLRPHRARCGRHELRDSKPEKA